MIPRHESIGEGVLSPTEPVEEISAEEFWQLLYSRIAQIHSGEVDFPVGEDVPEGYSVPELIVPAEWLGLSK